MKSRFRAHFGEMSGVAPIRAWLAIISIGLTVFMALDVGLARAGDKPLKIVAFGDSLTAGYMLEPSAALPIQLEAALKKRGYSVVVENAGVSGDTTAAGLARFDWAIPTDTDAVILELGANDALRGIDPELTRKNLERILEKLRERDIKVLIAGMIAPKNWGEAYSNAFDPIFSELAKTYGALYYPFILEGVATDAALSLDDGMHPNRKGVAEIVRRMLPKVEELIAEAKSE